MHYWLTNNVRILQPLRVMLSYESGQLVQQQQIMFLSPDSRISILTNADESFGTTNTTYHTEVTCTGCISLWISIIFFLV